MEEASFRLHGFHIVQANVKASKKRLKSLVTQERLVTVDVFALQDVPPDLPYQSFRNYHFIYRQVGDEALTEYNNPTEVAIFEKAKPPRLERDVSLQKKLKIIPLFKVAFLVSKSISLAAFTSDWYPDDPNHSLLVSLHFKTVAGQFTLLNTYNAIKNGKLSLDVKALLRTCAAHTNFLLVGDVNYHHEWWGGAGVVPNCPEAVAFAAGLRALNARCILDPAEIPLTYSRGTDTSQNTSTIDVAFLSESLWARFVSYNVLEKSMAEQDSDHRALETVLDFEPIIDNKKYYRWEHVTPEEWRKAVGPQLMALTSRPLNTTKDIDGYVEEAIEIMQQCRDKIVPKRRKPGPRVNPVITNPWIEKLRKGKDKLQQGSPEYDKWAKSLHDALRAERTKRWRKYVHEQAKETPAGVFRVVKLAVRLSTPRASPQIPDLVEPARDGGKKTYHKTGPEKAAYIVKSIWPDYNLGPKSTSVLECPELMNYMDAKYDPNQKLKPGELSAALRAVPPRKSPGHDGIPAEALKMLLPQKKVPNSEDIFTLVFERPMQACLDLSHHPELFKKADTVMLRKAAKPPTLGKSYRPVALLVVLGKVLERLFCNRLTHWLLEAQKVLPNQQYGVKGRNTTQAVEVLVSAIYYAWSAKGVASDTVKKVFASLMTLDITGAYDHVRRRELLETMIKVGVPAWLVRFVLSFLSRRTTTVRFPGHEDDQEYSINIGIPQGSPLSPILFVFFTLPILEELSDRSLGRRLVLSSWGCFNSTYVDDITILVISESHERNNVIFARIFADLLLKTEPKGISFGPDKLHVMHLFQERNASPYLEMPEIEGLPEGKKAETKLQTLGVVLDYRLTWEPHVYHVLAKFRRKMWPLKRAITSVSGPTVEKLRRMFLSSRAIISHACAVWWVVRQGKSKCRWSISQKLIDKLETEHSHWVKKLFGAYERTSPEVVRKEVFIEDLSVFLTRTARVYRAKNYNSHVGKAVRTFLRPGFPSVSPADRKRHPYKALYDEAKKLVLNPATEMLDSWRKKKNEQARKKNAEEEANTNGAKKKEEEMEEEEKMRRFIKLCASVLSKTEMKDIWTTYVDKRRHSGRDFNKFPPALEGTWGSNNLYRHQDLSKAQSTILLHCRTGVIGLNASLHHMGLADTFLCTCDRGPHNARHLFMDCTNLNAQREHLKEDVGLHNFTFENLLNRYTPRATEFAIRNFHIKQFRWTAKHMLNDSPGNPRGNLPGPARTRPGAAGTRPGPAHTRPGPAHTRPSAAGTRPGAAGTRPGAAGTQTQTKGKSTR